MLKNLSEKIDNQIDILKGISKCFETLSPALKDTRNRESLSDLKTLLKDIKPVLTDLENDINNLENSIPIDGTISEEQRTYYNNTLVISEIQKKVILPYTLIDLQRSLEKNKNYSTFEEIIDNVYTISIENYRNPFKARFREGYNLMRKKEKASIVESLSLALELYFNTSLNAAIITACKNLDELDTYLDCLSDNELNKFDIFNIKYEILPHK